MSSFTGPLDLRRIGNDQAALLRPLEFYLDQPGGWHVRVPIGFISDGASIPYHLRWLVGHPFGEMLRSAIVHDWLYWTHEIHKGEVIKSISRKEADLIFRKAMTIEQVVEFRKKMLYSGVRIGGSCPWAEEQPRSDKFLDI